MGYVGLVLADIHIGALPIAKTYEEIDHLKEQIAIDGIVDYIIIAGDYFDKKLYSDEKYIFIANELLLFLMEHCRKLRIVNGTSSHENHQYRLFEHYFSHVGDIINREAYDLKIIYSVEEEELFPDFWILYLPEEYLYDKKTYYEEYFKNEKKYDYVFGHGIIAEAMTNAVRAGKKSVKEHRKKPPVFTTAELENLVKGQVLFGHYHVRTNIHDKVFYVGSWSRYKFGEDEAKGFYRLCNENQLYTLDFIPNEKTDQYVTISFPYGSPVFSDGDELPKKFKEIKKKKINAGIEYLRLIFNIPLDYENPEFFINLANETFLRKEGYKIEIANGYIEQKKKVNKERFREIKEKFSFVLDQNGKIEDNISIFSKEQLNRDISSEKVKEYLTFRAIDLLEKK